MKRNLILAAAILLVCALLWLPDRRAPLPTITEEPRREPPVLVDIENREIPQDATEANARFSARLRAALNRADVRADEAVLAFKNADALRRFLARAQVAGVDVLGRLDALNTLRVRVRDHDALTRELASNAQDYLGIATNPIFAPPAPPVAEDRAPVAAAPVGRDLAALLGVDPADTARGRGVTIAILDGGASPGDAFGTRLSYLDIGYGITGYGDDGAHATAVAALAGGSAADAPGVAPGARLLSIKVTGPDGLADAYSVAAGILAALEAGARVINVSLGSHGDSPVLAAAVEHAVAAGVAVVASAGNDQAAVLAWPAAYPGVVSVGATDGLGRQAIFSNSGDTLQLTAPGYAVTTVGAGDTRVSFSGTSASAPVVAGAIATLLAADPELTPLAAADILATHGNDGGAPGPDPDYGRATLNLGRALDRDNPDRVDAAIAGFGYDPATRTLSVTVQNRGTATLSGLALSVTLGDGISTTPLPSLAPAASATVTAPIPAAHLASGGPIPLIATLTLPAGQVDRDTYNNQVRVVLTPP